MPWLREAQAAGFDADGILALVNRALCDQAEERVA